MTRDIARASQTNVCQRLCLAECMFGGIVGADGGRNDDARAQGCTRLHKVLHRAAHNDCMEESGLQTKPFTHSG